MARRIVGGKPVSPKKVVYTPKPGSPRAQKRAIEAITGAKTKEFAEAWRRRKALGIEPTEAEIRAAAGMEQLPTTEYTVAGQRYVYDPYSGELTGPGGYGVSTASPEAEIQRIAAVRYQAAPVETREVPTTYAEHLARRERVLAREITVAPTPSVVRVRPTRFEEFKAYVKPTWERPFATARKVIEYPGEKIAGLVMRGKYPKYAEAMAVKRAAQILPQYGKYFIPWAGPIFLAGEPVERLITPSGRVELEERERAYAEAGYSPFISRAITYGPELAQIGLGTLIMGRAVTKAIPKVKAARLAKKFKKAEIIETGFLGERIRVGKKVAMGEIAKYQLVYTPKKILGIARKPQVLGEVRYEFRMPPTIKGKAYEAYLFGRAKVVGRARPVKVEMPIIGGPRGEVLKPTIRLTKGEYIQAQFLQKGKPKVITEKITPREIERLTQIKTETRLFWEKPIPTVPKKPFTPEYLKFMKARIREGAAPFERVEWALAKPTTVRIRLIGERAFVTKVPRLKGKEIVEERFVKALYVGVGRGKQVRLPPSKVEIPFTEAVYERFGIKPKVTPLKWIERPVPKVEVPVPTVTKLAKPTPAKVVERPAIGYEKFSEWLFGKAAPKKVIVEEAEYALTGLGRVAPAITGMAVAEAKEPLIKVEPRVEERVKVEERAVQVPELKTRPLIKVKVEEKARVIEKLKPIQISKVSQIPITREIVRQIPKVAQVEITRTLQLQRQRLAQITRAAQIGRVTPITRFPGGPPPPIPLPSISLIGVRPKVTEKVLDLRKRAYIALLKRKGKWIRVSPAVELKTALGLAMKAGAETLGATVKVIPVAERPIPMGKIDFLRFKKLYREYRIRKGKRVPLPPLTFIQYRRERLGRPEEVAEIMAAKKAKARQLLATKKKKIRAKRARLLTASFLKPLKKGAKTKWL